VLLSHEFTKDHACGGMIAYAGEWHEEVPSIISNQVEE